MTFTYSGNPLGSASDEVRFLLGDTKDPAKFSDEELSYLLHSWDDDTYAAAAAGADIIANNAAAYYDFASDGGSSSIGQLQERYRTVARQLRQTRAQRGLAPFYVGGIDVADVYAADNDLTAVPHYFGTGMHDNGCAGGSYGGNTREDLLGEQDWR